MERGRDAEEEREGRALERQMSIIGKKKNTS